MVVVHQVVPDVPEAVHGRGHDTPTRFREVLTNADLGRLNLGVLVLHAVLMSLFIAVPFSLRASGLEVNEHWKVYLPVILGSFVLMLPALVRARSARQVRAVFLASVVLILGVQLALPASAGGVWQTAGMLLAFFTAFNVLEATLPALSTRHAPAGGRGSALGVFTSIQFLGTFLGAAAGGWVYGRWGMSGIMVMNAGLVAVWLVLAWSMTVPAALSTREYAIPVLDAARARGLAARLRVLPGVHEASVPAGENLARLRVDSAGFDEENVRRLIAGES
jgi:predicted MFS family arabinose efflux permease